jgi:integrator complex subunit 11
MRVHVLGAGQDVGKSCLVLEIGRHLIMLDCGIHMVHYIILRKGYNDSKRFPDFDKIPSRTLDFVLITHFHLDHSGALPYFVKTANYKGPVIMTPPTRDISPYLMQDYSKLSAKAYSFDDIHKAMLLVKPINLNQTLTFGNLSITAYYAGHVLGAAMFYIQSDGESFVYTGDYNMTPDRHLAAAKIPRLKPTLLVTESTYATVIRDSKKRRERQFLEKVKECVTSGGKVLVPVFALGRAQELCIMLEAYWAKHDMKVPIYFQGGITQTANEIYKKYPEYMNEYIQVTSKTTNVFDFKYVKPFEMSFVSKDGPMVLFASPGMLHAGTSLEVFKHWCNNPINMVILPGYCVAGTIGAKVLMNEKKIQIDPWETLDVQLRVENLSFSAHADKKGIIQLIDNLQPQHVMFVHGERSRISALKAEIEQTYKIPCFEPANGVTISVRRRDKRQKLLKIYEELLTGVDLLNITTDMNPLDSQIKQEVRIVSRNFEYNLMKEVIQKQNIFDLVSRALQTEKSKRQFPYTYSSPSIRKIEIEPDTELHVSLQVEKGVIKLQGNEDVVNHILNILTAYL